MWLALQKPKAGSLRAVNCSMMKIMCLRTSTLLSPPAQSTLVQPILVSGRWMHADDVRKLAVSEGALKYYPNLKTGDLLNLKIEGRKQDLGSDRYFQICGP